LERASYLGKIAEQLADEDGRVRSAACLLFGKCSAKEREQYLDTIAELLNDKDWNVRSAACSCFGKCSALERASYLGKIAEQLADEDGRVRIAACLLFGKCSTKERELYLGKIAERLADDHPNVMYEACSFFGKCSAKEREPVLDTIAERLADEDVVMRCEAWSFFEKCSAKEREPFLRTIAERLADHRWKVRCEACSFFEKCSESERATYLETIAERLADEDWNVRIAACSCFGKCSDSERASHLGKIAELLNCNINDEDWNVRYEACWFFGRCSAKERAPHLDTIAERLADKHWRVRSAACSCFGKCSDSERAPHLGKITERLADEHWNVREAASSCFEEFRGLERLERVQLLGVIAELLGQNGIARGRAWSFFVTCSESKRAPLLGMIAERLNDKDSDMRERAWSFFGSCSESERAPLLGVIAEGLTDKDSDVRDKAWSFFGKCSGSERAPHLRKIAEGLTDEDYSEAAFSLFNTLSSLEVAPCLPDLVGLLQHREHTIQDAALSLLQKDPSLFRQALDSLSSDDARHALANRKLLHNRTMLHILAMATDGTSAEWRAAMCGALAPWTSEELVDDADRTAFDVGRASPCRPVKQFFERFGTLLGRYRVNPGLDEHTSATSVVKFASDVVDSNKCVALKLIKSEQHFLHELEARAAAKNSLDTIVSRVYGWHHPRGWNPPALRELPTSLSNGRRDEPTPDSDEYPFVLVLERCDVSAHAYVSKQRIAGFKADEVVDLMRPVAQRVSELHAAGLAHLDLKLRNVLLRLKTRGFDVLLCDMDAALLSGKERSKEPKIGSSAYFAPEVMQWSIACDDQFGLNATTATDVWAFGTVLFELCTGRHLFAQDISDDEILRPTDKTRLCTWNSIDDAELDEVFGRGGNSCSDQQRKDAKHLIRWCLQGDPARRPTFDEVLAHPFLSAPRHAAAVAEGLVPRKDEWLGVQYSVLRVLLPVDGEQGGAVPVEVRGELASLHALIGDSLGVESNSHRGCGRMRYHAFLSHNQMEASGDVTLLCRELEALGLNPWRDMSQLNITEEGMKQGVFDSDVFILVLTNSVLSRKFCLKELSWALAFG
jgi:serine/threonine protein kinase/HEAT repeat protein